MGVKKSPDPLMLSLLHAAHALEARIEAALETVDLSLPKLNVLTQLVLAGEPLPLSDLAARMACVRSNITQLVDRLEADGLVKREDDPSDRRSIRAALTPLGRERQRSGEKQLDALQAAFAGTLSDADRAALTRAFATLP
jgi:DNA-binding MarR family transcriptional regulator